MMWMSGFDCSGYNSSGYSSIGSTVVVVAVLAAVVVATEVLKVLSGSTSGGNRAGTVCACVGTNMCCMCSKVQLEKAGEFCSCF